LETPPAFRLANAQDDSPIEDVRLFDEVIILTQKLVAERALLGLGIEAKNVV